MAHDNVRFDPSFLLSFSLPVFSSWFQMCASFAYLNSFSPVYSASCSCHSDKMCSLLLFHSRLDTGVPEFFFQTNKLHAIRLELLVYPVELCEINMSMEAKLETLSEPAGLLADVFRHFVSHLCRLSLSLSPHWPQRTWPRLLEQQWQQQRATEVELLPTQGVPLEHVSLRSLRRPSSHAQVSPTRSQLVWAPEKWRRSNSKHKRGQNVKSYACSLSAAFNRSIRAAYSKIWHRSDSK